MDDPPSDSAHSAPSASFKFDFTASDCADHDLQARQTALMLGPAKPHPARRAPLTAIKDNAGLLSRRVRNDVFESFFDRPRRSSAWSLVIRRISVGLSFSALVLVSVVGVSCASGSEDDVAFIPASTVLDASELQDVLKRSVASYDRAEAVFARCMRDAGLDYTPRSLSTEVTTDGGGLRSLSSEQRTIGYGIVDADGVGGVIVTVFGGVVPASQAEGYVEATSEGGACVDDLNDVDVQFDLAQYMEEFTNLPSDVRSDPRVVAELDSWAGCMEAFGYEFRSSVEAFDFVESKFRSTDENDPEAVATLAEEEIQIATADADCFDKTLRPVLSVIERGGS